MFACEYIYERLPNGTVHKENRNTDKTFSVTTFGFEMTNNE